MSAALKAVPVPEAEGVLDAVRPALIPPGEYDLLYLYHETGMLFAGKAPKLSLWFKVVTLGPFLDAKVARHYNVKRLLSKPGKGGRFAVGWHCSFATVEGANPAFRRCPRYWTKSGVLIAAALWRPKRRARKRSRCASLRHDFFPGVTSLRYRSINSATVVRSASERSTNTPRSIFRLDKPCPASGLPFRAKRFLSSGPARAVGPEPASVRSETA